ncbi:hypothetical protein ACEQPO_22595 [Bacillus sp. SL00103]
MQQVLLTGSAISQAIVIQYIDIALFINLASDVPFGFIFKTDRSWVDASFDHFYYADISYHLYYRF